MLSVANVREVGRDVTFSLRSPEPICVTQVNRFRHIISTEIELQAVDIVTVYENGSDLKEEIIAHRLGLLPLSFPDGEPTELTLDLIADRTREVLSSELVGKVRPLVDDIVICRLKAGKRLKLVATPRRGTGLINAKWAPLSNFTFSPETDKSFSVQMRTVGKLPVELLIEEALRIYNGR